VVDTAPVASGAKARVRLLRLAALTGLLVLPVLVACAGADGSGDSDRSTERPESVATAGPPEAVT
jgi:hypothetical protein